MLVDFFNSLDPYKFFAEAPLFLLFFLPGIIGGVLLCMIHSALALFNDEVADVVAFFGYVCWLFFLGDFATNTLHTVGVTNGISTIAAVIAVLFLNSASTFSLIPLVRLIRRVSEKNGEE